MKPINVFLISLLIIFAINAQFHSQDLPLSGLGLGDDSKSSDKATSSSSRSSNSSEGDTSSSTDENEST